MCKECFFSTFEDEVHRTIVDAQLFARGDRVAVGASGGKGMSVMILGVIVWRLDIQIQAVKM